MPTANFTARLRAQVNHPRLRFVYDGTNYDNSRILSVSNIHRDKNLSIGFLTITLENSDETFNYPITNNLGLYENALTNPITATLQLYFSDLAEYITLFTGRVERIDYEGKVAIFHIRDRLAQILDRPVGDSVTPIAISTDYSFLLMYLTPRLCNRWFCFSCSLLLYNRENTYARC